jgi:hypothetical protein
VKKLALLLLLPVSLAYGQTQAPAAPAAPEEKTVDKTASPELVGQLVNDLGVTPTQAEGAAGALFGLAKSRLSAQDFGKVAGAVPNMDGLLKAAPAAAAAAGDAKSTGVDALLGKAAASAGGTVAAASTLSKLGLKPETIAKVAPALIKAVQAKGGAEIGTLLAGALK